MPDPKPPTPSAPLRQLSMALDPARLRGMSPAERRAVVALWRYATQGVVPQGAALKA